MVYTQSTGNENSAYSAFRRGRFAFIAIGEGSLGLHKWTWVLYLLNVLMLYRDCY
jgi:hypothetical protein